MPTDDRRSMRSTPTTAYRSRIIIVAGVLIAVSAVDAARQRAVPSVVAAGGVDATPALDDDRRYEAAQVAAAQRAVDGLMTFDRQYVVEPVEVGTSQLTTATRIEGRQVDVRSVLG